MLVTHTKDGVPLVRRTSRSSCSTEKQLVALIFFAFCVVLFGGFFFLPDSSDMKRSGTDAHRPQDYYGVFVENEPLDAPVKAQPPPPPPQPAYIPPPPAPPVIPPPSVYVPPPPPPIKLPPPPAPRAPPPQPGAAGASKWRSDGRCGPRFPAPGAPSFGQCDPSANADRKGPCCNPESGFCGNVRDVDWGHCDCPTCVDYSVPGSRAQNINNFNEPSIPKDLPKVPGKRFVGPASDVIGPLRGQSYETSQSIQRKNKIKQMMKTAWDGYRNHAWGHNELMPKAKRGHSAGIFGRTQMGATIVDALDTLYIMGLHEEFKDARDWIEQHLHFDVSAGVSVFEVVIRFLAGLLTGYAFTGDEMFVHKAVDLADRLMPAFRTKTGVPKAMVNLKTGATKNWGWASGGCSILSEFGTMQLEFEYLSQVSGNSIYAQKVAHVMEYVTNKPLPANGLYPNYLHPDKGSWGSNSVSIGALGDSFYEYLLKFWVFQGGRDGHHVEKFGREKFDQAMTAMRNKLFQRSKPSNLLYIAEGKGNSLLHKMGHLACFSGGMLALAAKGAPTVEQEHWYLQSGADITETCYQSYHRSPTHIGPEAMLFDRGHEASNTRKNELYYILRPEVIEAYFYLWRMTHEQKYRDYAWEAAEAIEKHCRCGTGYCGIKDVSKNPPQQDDVQQSFFLAETLKYLYLIFSEDNVVDLDNWVFNTEAHPVPVRHPE
eukprot:m.480974 g.480974  ORF g.480974 m.480974 type:complete len:712 (+) comp22012_c0_seq1:446-2581(+)